MESTHTQTSTPLQRMRTTSNTNSINNSGAVHKNSLSRHRSISNSQADRLYQIALDQSSNNNPATSGVVNPTSVSFQWLTPHPSPQPSGYPDVALEPFPEWTVPTPPRSDSGVPPVSVDPNEDIVTTAISASPELAFEDPINSSEMSSLGFLLPAQYGGGVLEAEPTSYAMDPNYIPPVRESHPSVTSGSSSIANTVSSSPSMYQSRMTPVSNPDPRPTGVLPGISDPTFTTPDYRRGTNPYDSPVTTGEYSVAPSQTVPAMSGMTHSPMHSPHMSGMAQYQNPMNRSPSLYDPTLYGTSAPQFTSGPPSGAAPHAFASTMQPQHSMSYPPPFVGSSVNEVLAKPLGSASSIRVLNQRPKPQCWEHGCNGRQFSTFSNLLRHQREKSGTAAKAYCPKCGAEFTRTTARNGHLAHDKCTRNGAPTGPVTGSRRSSDEK